MNIKKLYTIVLFSLISINAWALYYGEPVIISGDNIGGVEIKNGDTPFPTNSVFPVPLELRNLPAKYLKIVNGVIVEKTTTEKNFVDLNIKYKKLVNNVWIEMTAEEKRLVDLPAKYKNPDGSEMTQEQKAIVDAAEEAARQAEIQTAKPLVLKKAENAFLTMCDTLTGTNTHTKLGFEEIKTIIFSLPTEQQLVLSVQLLSIDAELKREGGNLWWDTCEWHKEIVE